MTDQDWAAVDRYLGAVVVGADPVLDAVLQANADAGLPAIDVSPAQGRFLSLLVRLAGARSILEVGTLGGYSTICLARALPPGGRLTTLEVEERHAAVARVNLTQAGVSDRVEIRVGPALDSLPSIEAEGGGAFDLVFIDADKANNPRYVEWALRLTRPGSVIVIDNVIRGGRVLDSASDSADVRGTRETLELLGREPRLEATAIQTVGSKGWDGFAVAVVRE
ncbi:MAG: O-methyltransferase [Acidimicrobiales bacterium]